METKIKTKMVAQEEQVMKEYSTKIDGVIEVLANVDAKAFFDGLLDKIIEYVEAHHALAALGMSYKEYKDEEDDEAADGAKAT